ncbi:MAG: hypothetical protein H8E85_03375 [Candidatus Marinimicrobia bacterium]|nr:hypothetical protein [Candidatus Neomarinimicrobiota bacterium]
MKLLGSPFLALVFTICFILFLVRYWKLLQNIPFPYKLSLISLRSVTIIILLLLLINPWVDFKKNEQFPQNIDIIFDLSESMLTHFNKMGTSSENITNDIRTYIDVNKVDLNYYRLGEKIIKLDDPLSADVVTDFTNLPDFIGYENPNQVILITDGKATVGRELNNLNLPRNSPIHIIGVGPTEAEDDLAIDRIIIPPRSNKMDTVKLIVKITTQLQNDITTQLQLTNENGDSIYNKSLSFKSGIQNNELEIAIPAMNFNGINNANLFSLVGEPQIENNQYSFRVNVQSEIDKILLISGALSPNSSIIKSILNSLDAVEVRHHFRLDNIQWNENPDGSLSLNPKMIVLDDFPSGNSDRFLFEELVKSSRSQQIPIVYLEGPKSNLTTGEIIRSQFQFFIPTAIEPSMLTSLSDEYSGGIYSGIKLSSFPPQARMVKWTMEDNDLVNYIDGSFLIAKKNNVYMVALPDITENHLKTQNNFTSPIFTLIKKLFLHAYHGNEGLLSLHIDGSSFNKGEIIIAKLLPVENLGLSNFTIKAIHSYLDTITTDCAQDFPETYYHCKLAFQLPGEYLLSGEANLPDGLKITSNEASIIVQGMNIELKELIQEKNILMQVAYNSGGIYVPIESLDSMFSNIEITPVQLMKNYQISGLSTQEYWWLLIVLLSLEWFLRKKYGLL